MSQPQMRHTIAVIRLHPIASRVVRWGAGRQHTTLKYTCSRSEMIYLNLNIQDSILSAPIPLEKVFSLQTTHFFCFVVFHFWFRIALTLPQWCHPHLSVPFYCPCSTVDHILEHTGGQGQDPHCSLSQGPKWTPLQIFQVLFGCTKSFTAIQRSHMTRPPHSISLKRFPKTNTYECSVWIVQFPGVVFANVSLSSQTRTSTYSNYDQDASAVLHLWLPIDG